MSKKTKKAQVVIAAIDSDSQTMSFLLLMTNARRGNFWQNVTGKIEADESYEDGALREAMEETNLKVDGIVDMIDLGITHEFIDERKRDVIEKSFLLVLDHKWEVKLDPEEHENFKWVRVETISAEDVKHTGNFEALDKAARLLTQWGL